MVSGPRYFSPHPSDPGFAERRKVSNWAIDSPVKPSSPRWRILAPAFGRGFFWRAVMQNRTVMLWLGYTGLLPFYGFFLGAWMLEDWPAAVSVQGFIIYSLGILCFLGGTLWGRVQGFSEPDMARLLVSNGVVLFAVAAVLTAKIWLAAVALMGGYLALLWYERGAESLPLWYRAMRRNLTFGVVLAHVLFFVLQSVQSDS